MVLGVSAVAMAYMLAEPATPLWPLRVLACWFSWVAGATAAELYRRRLPLASFARSPWTTAILGVTWLVTSRRLPTVLSYKMGTVVCASAFLALLQWTRGRDRGRAASGLRWLAASSYSLYLTHLPLLALLAAWWYRTHDRPPSNPVLFLAGTTSAVLCGWFGFQAVERHFIKRARQGAQPLHGQLAHFIHQSP
jgi:peptidoglycan/LPS O-acetylase OafA/YrhL